MSEILKQPAPSRTDKEAILEMLQRAGIPVRNDGPVKDPNSAPEGSTSFVTDSDDQRHPGGYVMSSEFVFGPDGSLHAVWNWE